MIGEGELWGRGLEKGDGPAEERPGAANKLIALKRCHNVLLRDISLRAAGHFGVLATAVDNLTIDNVKIDTGRDGIDIDSCRRVHIHGCSVNSPWDDAIVLKSSYSLGELRATEQVTISDCIVTGSYQMGSMLDGSDLAIPAGAAGDWPARVGRIKIGTETNGDIRNVVVSNCVLDGCHGLAVISEDGGTVEDISFSNITMRNMIGPPIFVRLGGRMREPAPAKVSVIRRVSFDQIDCVSATSDDCSILAGIPGHPVQQITVRGLRVHHPGRGKLRTTVIPEALSGYPEPNMFGPTPAHGFYLRHAETIELNDVVVEPEVAEQRPLVWMDDVQQSRFEDVRCAGVERSSIACRIEGVKTHRISINEK
jgi:polygalacturonase